MTRNKRESKHKNENEHKTKTNTKTTDIGKMNTDERQTKIRKLRESLIPDNFDAWVCLGGDFRDMREVQEWATEEEKAELLAQYSEFRAWVKENNGK